MPVYCADMIVCFLLTSDGRIWSFAADQTAGKWLFEIKWTCGVPHLSLKIPEQGDTSQGVDVTLGVWVVQSPFISVVCKIFQAFLNLPRDGDEQRDNQAVAKTRHFTGVGTGRRPGERLIKALNKNTSREFKVCWEVSTGFTGTFDVVFAHCASFFPGRNAP